MPTKTQTTVKTQAFVEYLHLKGDSYRTNSTIQKVKHRDPQKILETLPKDGMLDNGEVIVGFRFFDSTYANYHMIKPPLMSGKTNKSGWFYIGREMTLDRVKQELPDNGLRADVVRDMETRGLTKIVFARENWVYALRGEDQVLEVPLVHKLVRN